LLLKKRTREETRNNQAKMAISLDARDHESVSRRTHEALTKKQRSTKASSVLAIQQARF
jgi:hypothetical protein